MTSKLDQSLDSIIDSTRKTQRKPVNKPSNNQSNNRSNDRSNERSNDRSTGPIRKGRSNNNNNRSTPYMRDQSNQSMKPNMFPSMFMPPVVMPQASQQTIVSQKVVGDTIHISNLDKSVTADDLTDIFKSCGNIKSVNQHFDQSGQSISTATITFNRKNDAAKAVDEFDGAEVDGRVMHIKLVGEVVKHTNQPKAPAAAASPFGAMTPEMMQQFAAFQATQMMQQQQVRNQQTNQSNRNQPRRNDNNRSDNRDNRDNQSNNQSKRGVRAAGRGGRRGDNPREKKPVSAEDLDAQLDTYHTKKVAADATPVAAESTTAE